MKYKERPVTIDAVKYQPGGIQPAWFGAMLENGTIMVKPDGTLAVKTHQGVVQAEKGDYIILDMFGAVYPCAAELFERAYERVVGRSERDGRISV